LKERTNLQIIEVDAQYTNLGGKVFKDKIELVVQFVNENDVEFEIIVDKEVQKNLFRVKGGDVIVEAGELMQNGEYEQAIKLLDALEQEIKDSGNTDDEIKKLRESMAKQKQMIEDMRDGHS